jgi:hypothetical protein
MSLPATDTFTDSDGVELPTHNAGWTAMQGAMKVNTNQATGKTDGPNGWSACRWSGDAFNGDHYSQAKWTGGNYAMPMVRCQAGSASGYIYFNTGQLYRADSGSLTDLGTSGPVPGSGDTFRLEITGSTLAANVNGGSQTTKVDATYSGGAAGVAAFGLSGNIDDWEGGNLAAAGGADLRVGFSPAARLQ